MALLTKSIILSDGPSTAWLSIFLPGSYPNVVETFDFDPVQGICADLKRNESHPLARTVTASISTTAPTLGLSLAQYAAFAAEGYSNNWLADLDISTTCLDVFTSKHKLNVLVQNVLRVRDQLYIEIKVMDENVVDDRIERCAVVSRVSYLLFVFVGMVWLLMMIGRKITSVAKGRLSNLTLHDHNGHHGGTHEACSGPSKILARLRAQINASRCPGPAMMSA
ncbi:MAG: hypothetical protein Q9195_006706 [Heterodermia aff. obscurata]